MECVCVCVCVCVHWLLSHVQLFVTPWTVAHKAPLSMEFSKQESWNLFLSPGHMEQLHTEKLIVKEELGVAYPLLTYSGVYKVGRCC